MNADKSMTQKPDPDATSHSNISSVANKFTSRLLLQRSGRAQGFLSNIQDLLILRHVKLAAADGGHGGVLKDENFSRSQLASFAVHGGMGLLLLYLALAPGLPPPLARITHPGAIFAPAPYQWHRLNMPPRSDPTHGGGGGGARELLPATAGQAPQFADREQIVAPSVHTNPNAVLLVMPTLVGPDSMHLINPDLSNWGVPDAKALTGSDGPGCCTGMGNGKRSGLGDGDGPGAGLGQDGGAGGGQRTNGGGAVSRYPICSYCPRPDYSNEARLAKYQGSVMLSVVVFANGKAGKIEVVKSVGMGLDEKAIEAVRNWEFKPAIGPDGKAMAVAVPIEVVFQLF